MITSRALYTHTPVEGERGVCAAGHALAARAGVRVMQEGGNAVDALCAAAFTAFVVEPASCGIGGYGHISLWLGERRRFVSIDAYCRAPLAARDGMFEPAPGSPTYYGHPFTAGDRAATGPLAPAVPGAVAGFCEAQAHYGRLTREQVLAPAIEAAESGVAFTYSDRLGVLDRVPGADLGEETIAVLMPGGRFPRGGAEAQSDRFDTRALARTLRLISRKGPGGFYRGRVAAAIERRLRGAGGVLGRDDLAAYRTRTLDEPPLRYRGHEYVSCYDQVAYEALNIVERFNLAGYGQDSYQYRHLVAEALALAFTDSMAHYGDPDFVASPVRGLSSPAFAAARAKLIRMRRALPRPVAPGDPWPFDPHDPDAERLAGPSGTPVPRPGTSQVASADRYGNMASCCISIGSSFGSLVYVPEVGCFLNNAMQNFDPRSERPNSIAPGKMPIFAAPALVATRRGRGVFAASGSGGYRIETGVLHTFMNRVDHGMRLQAAVDHPRVHCQGGETIVDPRIPEPVRHRLRGAGHEVIEHPEAPGGWPYGRVCAVAWDPRRKRFEGGAGPSWQTAIAAY